MNLSTNTSSTPRLVVIVPEELADSTELARKVHSLALACGSEVFFLALLGPDEDTLAMARSLATLKAVTSDGLLAVSSKIVPSSAWLEGLVEVFRPGDTVVYMAEQRVQSGFLQNQALGAALAEKIRAPLIPMQGIYHPRAARLQRLLFGLVFWAGCLAIITGFSLLEFQVDRGIQGAAHTIFLMFTASIEIGAIYAWNKLFQQ